MLSEMGRHRIWCAVHSDQRHAWTPCGGMPENGAAVLRHMAFSTRTPNTPGIVESAVEIKYNQDRIIAAQQSTA